MKPSTPLHVFMLLLVIVALYSLDSVRPMRPALADVAQQSATGEPAGYDWKYRPKLLNAKPIGSWFAEFYLENHKQPIFAKLFLVEVQPPDETELRPTLYGQGVVVDASGRDKFTPFFVVKSRDAKQSASGNWMLTIGSVQFEVRPKLPPPSDGTK